MKVQDFSYQVCMRTMELLETTQHYKISEAHRKEVHAAIHSELDALIQKSMSRKKG
ncbi:MAG: hypothetical protein KAH38_06920 [Candidatus Hydrogenedentes bacterium]|nr:hypothetical protein [Candidatus Hydrogenedentota bacterium]